MMILSLDSGFKVVHEPCQTQMKRISDEPIGIMTKGRKIDSKIRFKFKCPKCNFVGTVVHGLVGPLK